MFTFTLRIPEELHARLTAQAAADRQPSTPRSCTCSRSPSTPSRRRRIALTAIRPPLPCPAGLAFTPGLKDSAEEGVIRVVRPRA
ncbi:toxin-antitoxin system HicB family antitoxin [Streptomyces sp. NPDC127066]|uniref:toxin-antitoxin system HicB family antitoxin n=1 Tax=Streptomyces sp. NPDC127066 TaxID=3347125 RepID=UPI00365EAA72